MQDTFKNGFTLVELLVAMAAAAIVMVAVISAYQVQVKGKNTQEITIDMQQRARMAMEVMEAEIQMAGCDSGEDSDAEIMVADVGELQFSMDIDGGDFPGDPDGDTDDANEIIRYALDQDTNGDGVFNNLPCHLGRETGGAGALETLGENIDVLNFVYLGEDEDGDGDPDVLSPLPLSGANRDDIRMIQVTIVARAEARGMVSSVSDNNSYMNQQDDIVLQGTGENVRRLLLTKTIACRNMMDD